jgi:hypothetical protein
MTRWGHGVPRDRPEDSKAEEVRAALLRLLEILASKIADEIVQRAESEKESASGD